MNQQRHRAGGTASSKTKGSPPALYDAALRHFESGRLGAAEERCRQALAIDPKHADCLHLLGLIHAAADKLDLAVELIVQAVRSNPNIPEYFSNLGTLLKRLNRFEEALKSYDLALKLKPDSVEIWIKLGELLQVQRRFGEALLTYDHALKLDGRNAEAANKGGLLLLELNRHQEALARFDLLQTISPDRADTLVNIGVCLKHLNRWEEAAASYRQSLEISSRNHEAHSNLGSVLIDLRRPEEALLHFRKALAIKPDFIAALNNLGIALLDLKRFEEALSTFDRALLVSPGMAELFSNKANGLKTLGRYEEALACYDRAITLNPGYVQAHVNRGSCLDEMMRMDEALSSYRDALALQPDRADAHWNIAINRLRAGDLKTGWIESEWRWKCPALRLFDRGFKQPIWLGGEPIDGKTLLLHSDQGLGDALQFCRYAPLVAARGARVILEVQPALRQLVSRLRGVSQVISKGEALPGFDLHCPLGSLPLAFDTTLDTVPATVPYLSAGDAADAWEDRLGSTKSPRVGLVWSGNPDHANDHNRSIPLEALLPLVEIEAQFISLQKDIRPSDQAVLREQFAMLDFAPELESFADTAALIEHLDLVITVDTSVAHLAGALGRPTWVFLPYVPDWRWLLDRTDSPWYPTARLFRQSEPRDWQSVVGQARAALQAFCRS